jgi:hypothetical protein
VPAIEKVKSLVTVLPFFLAVLSLGLFMLDGDRTISFFAFLVAAVLAGATIRRSVRLWSLATRGLLANANVKAAQDYVRRSADPMKPSRSGHQMKYTLEYTDNRGRTHTMTHTERARSEPRDNFRVLYDPRRPKKALITEGLPKFRIDDSGEVRLTSNVAALIGLIVSVGILCAWAFFYLREAA